MNRKLTAESESYHIANVAKGGWTTEKRELLIEKIWFASNACFIVYNQTKNSFFKEAGKDKKPWYEIDDLTPEEKEKKMKQAERDNLYNVKNKNFLARKNSFLNNRSSKIDVSKPPPSYTATSSQFGSGDSQYPSSFNAVPTRFKYPPKDMSKVDCRKCGEFGHFGYQCTKK